MKQRTAFTIIELLVVVSIIALLMGILLPAIAASRDQAQITRSQANLRQLAVAHATYASEWNDNQWTPTPHGLATYGSNLNDAVSSYLSSLGGTTKSVVISDAGHAGVPAGADHNGSVVWTAPNSHEALLPMNLQLNVKTFGYYQMINARSFNTYLGGRFYDATFYAPKDRPVLETIGECLDAPGEFCSLTEGKYGPVGSSYVLSPAALYTPDLFSQPFISKAAMWNMPALLRTPSFSQARYPELKTHMLEHHWLQDAPRSGLCNPQAPDYLKEFENEGCAPYFFNASVDSNPATLFYDGHVALLAVHEAKLADDYVASKNGAQKGLWHRFTPLGPGGYYQTLEHHQQGMPPAKVSYHILTREGILGRDTLVR